MVIIIGIKLANCAHAHRTPASLKIPQITNKLEKLIHSSQCQRRLPESEIGPGVQSFTSHLETKLETEWGAQVQPSE